MFTHRYTDDELADRQFWRLIPPKWEVYYARLRVTVGSSYWEQNMGLAGH